MSSVRHPSILTPSSSPLAGGTQTRRGLAPIVADALTPLGATRQASRQLRAAKPITPPSGKTTGKRKRASESTASSTYAIATSLLGTVGQGILAPLKSLCDVGSRFLFGEKPTTPALVADILQSPVVKIARWKPRRTPGGGVRMTPMKEQKSEMRHTDHALYVVEQKDPQGKVTKVYAGSVAKSGPGVKRRNSVHRRMQGYRREVKNPEKNRPVVSALRTFPEDCEFIVYRTVEGDESDLHDAEGALIDYVRRKHPDAKHLNVSDPRKEAPRTKGSKGPAAKRRKKTTT